MEVANAELVGKKTTFKSGPDKQKGFLDLGIFKGDK